MTDSIMMQIELFNLVPGIDTTAFNTTLDLVIRGENKPASFINVIFLPRDELRAMKLEYFGLDVYTDFITFNLNDIEDPLEGEIYLSHEQIRKNAEEYNAEFQTELHRVLIHGCLHLCGYEDDTPELKMLMTKLEDKYLASTVSEQT